ncbi:MAG TPA: PIG-L family deacetylase [Acidimicrobiales bacterium]|nr:PIG-L family deacetylase [Acidimicrobiales bacterium]
MATLVTFHAHPDDEAIATGGTMAKAAAEGHRVVLVLATRGELGEVPDDLAAVQDLAQRRTDETMEAARILGVHRIEFLGYRDSGMIGTPENEAPDCFWKADVEEAAARLASILSEEKADVLTIYDENGAYGHPDHIQVHRVGVRAAELAGTPAVYESTIDRDGFVGLLERAEELGLTPPDDIGDLAGFGVPGALITTRVDVTQYLDAKRAAMAAHSSQIAETSFFLNMGPEAFTAVWGQETYICRGAPAGTAETSLPLQAAG